MMSDGQYLLWAETEDCEIVACEGPQDGDPAHLLEEFITTHAHSLIDPAMGDKYSYHIRKSPAQSPRTMFLRNYFSKEHEIGIGHMEIIQIKHWHDEGVCSQWWWKEDICIFNEDKKYPNKIKWNTRKTIEM